MIVTDEDVRAARIAAALDLGLDPDVVLPADLEILAARSVAGVGIERDWTPES